MRLNKAVAHRSKYSRREAEKLIIDGKIKVGKKVVKDPAFDVSDEDEILHGYKRLEKSSEYTVIVYNKPKGELVTKKDDKGRKTIYHSLSGKFRHFIPVGRLDFASEGLLLLTDSSQIAKTLMDGDFERTYNLKISSRVTKAMIEAMENGIFLEDARKGGHEKSKIHSMEIKPFVNWKVLKDHAKFTRIRVTITEGQNRELRRFFAHFGADVLDLKRVRYADFELNALPSGKTRYLSREEYHTLREYLKESK
ncbi:MAG: pseudouridine synthase [Campylobacterales bacterium]|nr:pseudouridine synthase [Campylobacterales bacterium]